MKKLYIFIIILFLIGIGIGIFIYNKSNNHNNSQSYNSQKLSSSQNTSSSNENNSDTNTKTETEISNFYTKIYTKESDRQNNITLTCNTLNDTIVNNGTTFSFCDTVGKATTSKGYKKADVYQDGEVIQALGGGNCQVSTTLYNAVLKVQGINVTERHNHSNTVPYIEKGQDAAVSYGSYDFKFVNNTGYDLKIKASNDENSIYIIIRKY